MHCAISRRSQSPDQNFLHMVHCIFLSIPVAIQGSLTILQALTMDRHLGPNFKIPAGSMVVIPTISTFISLTLIGRFLCPLWLKLIHQSLTSSTSRSWSYSYPIHSQYDCVSNSGVKAAQNSSYPPAQFNSAHVGLVAVSSAGYRRHWRSISFSRTSCILLSRISTFTAKHINCNGFSENWDCLLFKHSNGSGWQFWLPMNSVNVGESKSYGCISHHLCLNSMYNIYEP